MKQNVLLNTTDGWEEIVNTNAMNKALAREREDARKREHQLNKMLLKTFVLAVISLAFAILGITGAMISGLAIPAALVGLVITSILLGRYLEAQKV
jgi:uncharacterized membrane protein (DUF4010 family)